MRAVTQERGYLLSVIILKHSKVCITTIKQAYSTHITRQHRTLLSSVLSCRLESMCLVIITWSMCPVRGDTNLLLT